MCSVSDGSTCERPSRNRNLGAGGAFTVFRSHDAFALLWDSALEHIKV
jgi:hypothetical protein